MESERIIVGIFHMLTCSLFLFSCFSPLSLPFLLFYLSTINIISSGCVRNPQIDVPIQSVPAPLPNSHSTSKLRITSEKCNQEGRCNWFPFPSDIHAMSIENVRIQAKNASNRKTTNHFTHSNSNSLHAVEKVSA